MNLRRKRLWLAIALVLGVTLTLTLLWKPASPITFDVPVPNGYDDFLAAADSVAAQGGWPQDYSDQQALRTWMSLNTNAFALVRTGLTKTCRVPIRVSADLNHELVDSMEWMRLKVLMRCLVAKGQLAHQDGRIADSFEAYQDAYRFAHQVGQGGLELDYLVHLACQEIFLREFQSLIPDLSRTQRAEMLALLDETEATEERAVAVAARKRRWDAATYSMWTRLRQFFDRLTEALRTRSWKPLRSLKRQLQEVENRHCTPFYQSLRRRLQASATEAPTP